MRRLALDPYDLALPKLARNSPIDRDDVTRMANAVRVDADILREKPAPATGRNA